MPPLVSRRWWTGKNWPGTGWGYASHPQLLSTATSDTRRRASQLAASAIRPGSAAA